MIEWYWLFAPFVLAVLLFLWLVASFRSSVRFTALADAILEPDAALDEIARRLNVTPEIAFTSITVAKYGNSTSGNRRVP
jgi:hypothetical protein